MQNRRISSIMCVQASHHGGGTMKSIYTYYKERLIEISGKNRSLYIRSFGKKTGYDLGRIFSADPARAEEFFDFLWSGWRDLNARPQRPERCALAKLSHIPLRKRT